MNIFVYMNLFIFNFLFHVMQAEERDFALKLVNSTNGVNLDEFNECKEGDVTVARNNSHLMQSDHSLHLVCTKNNFTTLFDVYVVVEVGRGIVNTPQYSQQRWVSTITLIFKPFINENPEFLIVPKVENNSFNTSLISVGTLKEVTNGTIRHLLGDVTVKTDFIEPIMPFQITLKLAHHNDSIILHNVRYHPFVAVHNASFKRTEINVTDSIECLSESNPPIDLWRVRISGLRSEATVVYLSDTGDVKFDESGRFEVNCTVFNRIGLEEASSTVVKNITVYSDTLHQIAKENNISILPSLIIPISVVGSLAFIFAAAKVISKVKYLSKNQVKGSKISKHDEAS